MARENRISTYVEDELKDEIDRYADDRGMSESQAIRTLTKLGLAAEQQAVGIRSKTA
ncbi:hypothetical protein [Nocardia phage P3.1]|nr:hypothetical protein [Nocardia phage P3.1]